jgi:hypothetical protein
MKPLAILLATTLSLPALAVPPTPESVKSVWDFYYGNSSDVILVEARLCTGIGQEDATRFECLKEIPGTVKTGTTVVVWKAWLVPQGKTVAVSA